ncbi:hypothetical protein MPER_00021, partial [Moniliophthora perniciosa FA553]
ELFLGIFKFEPRGRLDNNLPVYVSLSHDNPYLTAETFDVEEVLLSRSHTSLQDLRVELRDYLSNLKEELVQLINDDYEAFISLSTDLKGEGLRGDSGETEEKDGFEGEGSGSPFAQISESVTRLETLLISSPSDDADAAEMEGMGMNAGLDKMDGPTDERSLILFIAEKIEPNI